MITKKQIVGVDEVGRGSLFGPVFAGAVVLNKNIEKVLIKAGLKDSKKLTYRKRNMLFHIIKKNAIDWGIGQASHKEIDTLGIRRATEIAMIRALQKISEPIDMVLVDGILPISIWEKKQKTIIRGDSIYPSIAAASVIAKVYRDELVKRISKAFPNYDIYNNVGYGTKNHRQALIKLGATKLHRISFLSKIIN